MRETTSFGTLSSPRPAAGRRRALTPIACSADLIPSSADFSLFGRLGNLLRSLQKYQWVGRAGRGA